jgi:hypothetical protein
MRRLINAVCALVAPHEQRSRPKPSDLSYVRG